MDRDLIYPASWTCYSLQWFSCSSAAGLRWLCRRHADSRPRCSTNTEGRPSWPPSTTASHSRSKSAGLVPDCYQTAPSVTHDHAANSPRRVFSRPEPSLHLRPGYTPTSRDTPGRKTFLYSKPTDARVTQNAPTPGQLRCTKSGARRCDGLRLASAALSDKMN